MNDIALLPPDERRVYFEQAAARLGSLTPQLIEKDFWVCWILRQAFALPEFGPHLTFKGGTSLSKAYQLIERFSEDIDLAIERSYLGFGDDQEPEQGQSRNEQQRRVERLKAACQSAVRDRLVPALEETIAAILPAGSFHLELDADDPDLQSLRFHFPPALRSGLSPYFAPSVKLELGARSDHFPVEARSVRPYLADALPAAVNDGDTSIRVLHVNRTFWEKATILHALAHRPGDKPLPKSQSRHYYDLDRLASDMTARLAISHLDLLDRVAFHKSIYFASAQARYDLARPGTLRLIPDAARIDELRRDFRDMEVMFFRAAPRLDDILVRLRAVEAEINSARV